MSGKDPKIYSSLRLCLLILLCKCIHYSVPGMFAEALFCCNHETGLIYLQESSPPPPPPFSSK